MIFYDFVSSGASLSARLRSKKVSISRYLLFLYLWRKFTCRRRYRKQKTRLAAFCAVGLQGPLLRAEGKGVKRSDHRERSSQFSLSALNSLQGVDFQPCRLFYTQKVAPKMHRPRFYALLRAFFKLHISHTSYPIFSFNLTARNAWCNFSPLSVKKMHEKREPPL